MSRRLAEMPLPALPDRHVKMSCSEQLVKRTYQLM